MKRKINENKNTKMEVAMRGGRVKTSRKNVSQIYKSGHRSMILSSLISRLRKPLSLTKVKYA